MLPTQPPGRVERQPSPPETISDKDGRTSVISGMRELKQGGYLVRTIERDNGVIVRNVWTVFEEPVAATTSKANQAEEIKANGLR